MQRIAPSELRLRDDSARRAEERAVLVREQVLLESIAVHVDALAWRDQIGIRSMDEHLGGLLDIEQAYVAKRDRLLAVFVRRIGRDHVAACRIVARTIEAEVGEANVVRYHRAVKSVVRRNAIPINHIKKTNQTNEYF